VEVDEVEEVVQATLVKTYHLMPLLIIQINLKPTLIILIALILKLYVHSNVILDLHGMLPIVNVKNQKHKPLHEIQL
jgi:hypothetical protein